MRSSASRRRRRRMLNSREQRYKVINSKFDHRHSPLIGSCRPNIWLNAGADVASKKNAENHGSGNDSNKDPDRTTSWGWDDRQYICTRRILVPAALKLRKQIHVVMDRFRLFSTGPRFAEVLGRKATTGDRYGLILPARSGRSWFSTDLIFRKISQNFPKFFKCRGNSVSKSRIFTRPT